jgi:hypothetical protein
MLQILSKIPVFVWPLFALLLVGGLRARKTGMMPLALLLAIPSVFFTWTLFSFFSKYADPISIFLWIFCLSVGFFIGYLHMQKIKLRFDKQKRRVEMPGSWIPLILSMAIFSTKLSIGMIGSLVPELIGSHLLLGLDLFATVILGIFAGRGIGCLSRYRAASEDII